MSGAHRGQGNGVFGSAYDAGPRSSSWRSAARWDRFTVPCLSEMARAARNKDTIDAQTFGEMLTAALAGLRELGGAQVGDKTLMDVMIPAESAYREACAENKSFRECLDEMKASARYGMENRRKNLVAKVGRASRLGERSRDVLDAGATSCNLLLATFGGRAPRHISQRTDKIPLKYKEAVYFAR